ncbi:MAG TPA: tripartite tricarboxylate transporter TctB family protein [Candidatus Binatia bacterium]|nr:tripartite tricarboxylate transporter TctB family protein [Candidatus Binatia bacterium]
MLLVSGYAIFTASGWSFKTGFFPLAMAIPLLVLVLIHLYLETFGAPEISKGPAVEADFSSVPDTVARRRAVTIFAWIGAFIACVYLIGFPSTVPLFIFFYLKLQSAASWIHSVALTAITWGFFHLLFQRLVHMQFEAGAIQGWLGI